ncbi:hypothetical protein P5673_013000 [Acropora cervicornis]|uniref:Uncharacterized protein n=1 Tax=Acropora cervicornis TaxID=6130 RepID=A0AAD9QMH6_ACRCE|nr:hypothetical protein P5673_013000 [Acropora cervicornis]
MDLDAEYMKLGSYLLCVEVRTELVVALVRGISAVVVGKAEHMLQSWVPCRVELRDTGMPLAEA